MLPAELLNLLDGDLFGLKYVARDGVQHEAMRDRVFHAIYKYCFRIEDKPVVTRFWPFPNVSGVSS